ncbi:MAG: flagellar basal body-associated FliL family protein, partial [Micrococcales bacterium]|nr:flagellar basal body-associated FliL family protein [Micrococcales bacterium]
EKKSKKMLVVIVLVVALAGAGAWYFLKGSSSGSASEPTPTATSGPVVDLDSLTLNLADGRYLKLGLSLEVTEEAKAAAGKDGVNGAKARDAAISILGQRTYEQMLTPKTRAAAIGSVVKEIEKRYDGDVIDVYVTEFVMQ